MILAAEQYRITAEGGEGRRFTRSLRSAVSSVVQSRILFIDRRYLCVERSADALGRPLGEFASGASGRAAVFFDNPSPGDSMFVNIEAPILWNRGVLLDFQPSTYSYPGSWDLSAAGNYH